MAGVFSQDAVLHFLQIHGGSVKNSDLLLHFRNFIRNHPERDRNRELFKRYVNSVATVRSEDGVSYVVLRKKFRGHVPGDGGGGGGSIGTSCSPSRQRSHLSPAAVREERPQISAQVKDVTGPVQPDELSIKTTLPAAGIIVNNNNCDSNLKHKQQQQQQQCGQQNLSCSPVVQRHVESYQQGAVSQPPPSAREAPVHHGGFPHHQHQQQQLQQEKLGFDTPPGITPVVQYDVEPHQRGAVSQPLMVKEAPVHHGGDFPPHQQQQQQHQQQQLHQAVTSGFTPVVQYEVEPHQQGAVSQPLRVKEAPVQHLRNPALSEPPVRFQCTSGGQQRLGFGPTPAVTSGASHHAETHQQGAVSQPLIGGRGGNPCQEPPLQRRFRHRPSYKSALSRDDDDDEEEEEEKEVRRSSAGGVWPHIAPLEGTVRALSASSPSITESPAPPPSSSFSSVQQSPPKIYVQDVEVEAPPHPGQVFSFSELKGQWAAPTETPPQPRRRLSPSPDGVMGTSPHRNLHQGRHFSQGAGSQLEPGQDPRQRARLSSSHSSIFSASSDRPLSCSSAGSRWSSSYEDVLQATAGQAQGTKLESETSGRKPTAFHHSVDDLHDNQGSAPRVFPWHLSTGDLYADQDDGMSSDGSSFSSPGHRRPTARGQLSSYARSRMCRSLGADLDQVLQEEEAKGGGGGGGGNEAARLSRLQLISSSLSLRYNLSSSSLSSCCTPPRCHSVSDLMEEARGRRRSFPEAATPPAHSTSTQPEGSDKQSLVPLEPKEHDWLVKGAAGAWPDIYSLFREEPSLLNKRDFISGFTVLHWIAKHGDHRVLNTLWYGVQKAGFMFDINARSTSGHTPLHLAAIHGHKNIMRLLVKKFDADVKLRDNAGKKPWQYLSGAAPLEIYQLLGAPARAALRGDAGRGADAILDQQKQRRRRRHHFSTASGERPLTIAGTIRVKRSSSIAALLKHKSLRRFYGHKSDDLV